VAVCCLPVQHIASCFDNKDPSEFARDFFIGSPSFRQGVQGLLLSPLWRAVLDGLTLQVFKAEHMERRLRVYQLQLEESMEADKFRATLDRERSVFEDLIHQKGHMLLPTQDHSRVGSPEEQGLPDETAPPSKPVKPMCPGPCRSQAFDRNFGNAGCCLGPGPTKA
jgi:hypothetical protein